MEVIVHRINTANELKLIPKKYGIEIDIRTNQSDLILNHEIFNGGEKLINYLENYNHGTLVLNIKEAGIEYEVIKLMKEFKIKSYFLLDVEMPYLYSASLSGNKEMAVRFSEYEDISLSSYFEHKVKWIWIDTVTKLPLNEINKKYFVNFNTCLVCPERWGRPDDIIKYKDNLNMINFKLNAVMTNIKFAKLWEN